ncbi:ANTAR domain-containing protein [Kibdelosporangium phytohabitans]|uniref:ANTAR domain-containing protein n=1 Tax=Kibdelosporangium phytohabitans TaxID=860235 RepID=UPI001A0AFA08|nr:ANTAR domain-containing protein [Kibdelosporangium phytohabitans]MBE1470803.1 putative nucleic acid-binding Zn-ribbon protein [Kibdelosporangium phytohabitans]
MLVVGDRLYGDTGVTIGTTGYYTDLDPSLAEDRRQILDDAIPDLLGARAHIEQAKGALQWRSQNTNTKLRDLAERLAATLTALGGGPLQLRTQFDHLLLTIHQHSEPPSS